MHPAPYRTQSVSRAVPPNGSACSCTAVRMPYRTPVTAAAPADSPYAVTPAGSPPYWTSMLAGTIGQWNVRLHPRSRLNTIPFAWQHAVSAAKVARRPREIPPWRETLTPIPQLDAHSPVMLPCCRAARRLLPHHAWNLRGLPPCPLTAPHAVRRHSNCQTSVRYRTVSASVPQL